MSDPRRWRDTEEPAIRAFLRELSGVEPTPSMREGVWSKIASTLPPPPGSAPTGGGPEGSSPATSPLRGATPRASRLGVTAKLLALSAVVLGAAVVALWPAPAIPERHSPPSRSATAPLPVPVPVPVPVPDPPATPSPPLPRPLPSRPLIPAPSSPLSSPTPPTATPPPLPADRLREEAAGVRTVRQLLRAKDPRAALAELDRLAKLFPAGPLEEEREVLTIEALAASAASGDRELGRRRAERFLLEHPQSVHQDRVRPLTGR